MRRSKISLITAGLYLLLPTIAKAASFPASIFHIGDIGQIQTTDPTKTSYTGDLFTSVANIILRMLEYLAYPLAIIGILYTGFILVSSVGKPEAVTTAKKNFTYIATGIFLIAFAGTLFQLVLKLLAW